MAEVSEIEAGGEIRTIKDLTARKALVYSTDETDTGKKWIDGKPIYRKVLTATNKGTSGSFNFDQSIYNVDTIISVNGFIKTTTGRYAGTQYQIPRADEEVYFTDNTGIMTLNGRSTSVNADFVHIEVEYIKTTD